MKWRQILIIHDLFLRVYRLPVLRALYIGILKISKINFFAVFMQGLSLRVQTFFMWSCGPLLPTLLSNNVPQLNTTKA